MSRGSFTYWNKPRVVHGEDLVDAQPAFDQNGSPAVNFRFNPTGARKFGDYTAENIGSPFAIVLDNEVICQPPPSAIILLADLASFPAVSVLRKALIWRGFCGQGALPAEMTFLEERTIGPELGQDSIDAG